MRVPVRDLGHVARGDGEDVRETGLSPRWESGEDGLAVHGGVQPEERVGDVQLVLRCGGRGLDVVGGEVAIEVGQLSRELEGRLAPGMG